MIIIIKIRAWTVVVFDCCPRVYIYIDRRPRRVPVCIFSGINALERREGKIFRIGGDLTRLLFKSFHASREREREKLTLPRLGKGCRAGSLDI